ncbi:MAG: hypothetical protein KIT34_09790 [Cyanobacteria bacterium TGS_CYA1]|nr:hypothetical protein [Cyanobacteria bacterium TGS_CYA1]
MNNDISIIEELIASYQPINDREKRLTVEERREQLFKRIPTDLYAKLNQAIRQEISASNFNIQELLNDLLIFTEIKIDDLLLFWLETLDSNLYGFLFRDASDETEDKLFSVFSSNFSDENLYLLEYLPWCKSQRAFEQFVEWKKNPPNWNKRLHIPIHQYTEIAGWELDEYNQKRLLFSPICYELDIDYRRFSSSENSKCPLCLRSLLHLQLTPTAIAEIVPGSLFKSHVQLPFCNLCCRFNFGSLSLLKDEKVKIDTRNIYKGEVPDWIKKEKELVGNLVLKTERKVRNPYFAAPMWSKYKHSQLGGFPTWIQNPDYLRCPTCNQKMFFFMQFQEEEVFSDQYDGTFHFFLCTKCKDRFYVKQQFT